MSLSLKHAVGYCLLALWMMNGCGKSKPTPPPSPPQASVPDAPWFTDITQQVGLNFQHETGADESYFMPQIIGSGAALFDYDVDGDLDIYLVNGADRLGTITPPPMNRLFRREDDGSYRDVTTASGLGDRGYGMGVAIGDFDNDGYPDVYLANYGPDAFYRNNGDGSFSDVTSQVGVNNDEWACSAAFVDYDLDGYLDVFVVNYVDYPELKVCTDSAGRPEYCGPSASPPVADVLYHNNGDGTFTDVSASSRIGAIRGRGLGLICEDFNDDGWPDIYVTNDGDPNFLWISNGDGTFSETATMSGTAVNSFGESEASMGVTAGDVDDDGDLDLFMTHMVRESNTLYRNDGNAGFMDVTGASGLGADSMKFTGFGAAFFDFDHDSALDLVVANGRIKHSTILEGADRQSPFAPYAETNKLYHNDGSGRFEHVSDRAGQLCTTVSVSRGLAVGDIDNDGDLDVLISNCDGPARLFRNDVPKQGHWLIVRAIDPALQRDAYGATIVVSVDGRKIHRRINPGYSYASSCDPRAHFGLGSVTQIDDIEIRWPDGFVERFDGGTVDRAVTLYRTHGVSVPAEAP